MSQQNHRTSTLSAFAGRSAPFICVTLAIALLLTCVGSARPVRAKAVAPVVIGRCDGPPKGYVYASALPVGTSPLSPPPRVTSAAVAVIDGETGRTLLEMNAHQHRPPASTTKMLTAALTLEHGDLDRVIVSETDASTMAGSSVMGLMPGTPITVRDLLYGLLLPSGNDAALELAKAVSGSSGAFVASMNDKVRALRLDDTHFENPHGLDSANQFSSAYDLAMIARYAMGTPGFAGIVATPVHHLPPPFDYDLNNGNTLLGAYAGADGVKIGWTEWAGWTFVASATRHGHRVFVALMDTHDRDGDAASLLDWAWQSYRWVAVEPEVGYGLRLATRLGIRSAAIDALGACR